MLLCHPNDLVLLYEADVFLMDLLLAPVRRVGVSGVDVRQLSRQLLLSLATTGLDALDGLAGHYHRRVCTSTGV